MGDPDASPERRASLQKVFQMKLQMKREALEKLNRRANEMVPTTAADDLLAAPMCTVTVQ